MKNFIFCGAIAKTTASPYDEIEENEAANISGNKTLCS